MGFLANIITGILLDLPFSQSLKSKAVFIGVAIFITASWIWNAIVQVNLSSESTTPSLDLGEGPLFNSAFTVYMFFRFFYESLQTYVYWLMGDIQGGQRSGDISRTTGILRSWESIGSAIAYGIGATDVSNQNQMIVGFALWAITVPLTLLAIFGDWKPVELVADGSDEEGVESSSLEDGKVVVVGSEEKNWSEK